MGWGGLGEPQLVSALQPPLLPPPFCWLGVGGVTSRLQLVCAHQIKALLIFLGGIKVGLGGIGVGLGGVESCGGMLGCVLPPNFRVTKAANCLPQVLQMQDLRQALREKSWQNGHLHRVSGVSSDWV